eukprot:20660-Heterococcus_DN1.PRE.1
MSAWPFQLRTATTGREPVKNYFEVSVWVDRQNSGLPGGLAKAHVLSLTAVFCQPHVLQPAALSNTVVDNDARLRACAALECALPLAPERDE